MPAFRNAVQALARELGQRAAAEVTRAGVAIPGARRPDGSCWVPNVPYLSRPRLADELAAWLGVPALVENDAQLALLGEVWLGRANGRREVILVSVGTGIGGAVMYDGRIRRGAQGAAGAFGWMPVADAGGSEADTWETSAAGRALDTLAHRWRHGASGRDLVAAVRQGETQARQLWETWAWRLGRGMAALASLFDPEMILLAGGASAACDLLIPVLSEALNRWASPLARGVPIEQAALAERAAVYGAIRLAQAGTLDM